MDKTNIDKIEEIRNRYFKNDINKEQIDIDKIKNFEENPFKLLNREDLEELAESIKDEGLLNPIILWKRYDEYIILSGHNRIEALKILGYKSLEKSMYIIKENISIDDARIIVVDTNLVQRKTILPSERAKAYEMWKNSLSKKQTNRSENFVFENAVNTGEIAEHSNLYHKFT